MGVKEIIEKTAWELPDVEGPVQVTEVSHPFCAMEYSRIPLHVDEYGYVEEEFFLSGRANVYTCDENDQMILKKELLPYKNRVLVRRPEKKENFSGRVYVDIMNATQCYDIEDLWHRNYLWCMEHGHGYVGVTSKPVNVMSLKNFDYARYKDLNWSNGETIPYPSISKSATIPGSEEGLIWDILNQVGALLRNGGKNNCMGGYTVEYVYLCGQSQSGAYLNTYVSYFDSFISTTIFDGYLNMVGSLVQRRLCQDDQVGPLELQLRHMHPSTRPYICMSSEADLTLFKMFVPNGNLLDITIENSDTKCNKCRYYEIPGTPHTDVICPVLCAVSEIEKTGGPLPNLNESIIKEINDIHTEYYVCGMLEKLHIWARKGIAPEIYEPLVRENGCLKRDEHGNAMGGIRHPFVEVPIAHYIACNPDDPEKICGKMEYFSKEKAYKLYGTKQNYLDKFKKYVEKQIDNRWISGTDGKKMLSWAERAANHVFDS